MTVAAWLFIGCMAVMCLPGVQTRRGPYLWDNPGPYVSTVAEVAAWVLVFKVLF